MRLARVDRRQVALADAQRVLGSLQRATEEYEDRVKGKGSLAVAYKLDDEGDA